MIVYLIYRNSVVIQKTTNRLSALIMARFWNKTNPNGGYHVVEVLGEKNQMIWSAGREVNCLGRFATGGKP